MGNKWVDASLFLTALLSGLYGGTGFFTAMGGNPALKSMSDAGFAEFWQNVDRYMAARMPVFGPILLLSVIVSTILLMLNKHGISSWLMVTALAILICDMVFAFRVNHPLNHLIQSWDLNNLPSNVQEVKWKVIGAFNMRLLFMMSSFVLVLISIWLRKKIG